MKKKQYSIIQFYRNRMVILCVGLLVCGWIKAETRVYPVSFSILSQSWAFPLSEITRVSPFYPGVTAGIVRLREDKTVSFPQAAHTGFFYNHTAGSAAFLYADQSIRIAPKWGFTLDLSIGLGYFHAFHPNDVYRQKVNNDFEKVIDFGKPSILFSLSQSIGYDFSKKTSLPIAPFIKFQWMGSYPYFDMIMPIRPTNMVHIGTYIYL